MVFLFLLNKLLVWTIQVVLADFLYQITFLPAYLRPCEIFTNFVPGM